MFSSNSIALHIWYTYRYAIPVYLLLIRALYLHLIIITFFILSLSYVFILTDFIDLFTYIDCVYLYNHRY